jgi:hypothetical protein
LGERLLLALGRQGLELTAPDGVRVERMGAAVEPGTGEAGDALARLGDALARPLAGPPLRELAAGRRRAVVLVGDLAWPALYAPVLPEICRVLTEAGIRPSRISFLCRPGACGPTLGLAAIRRYGEETVGQYELRDWNLEDGVPAASDPDYEAADLRLVVLPLLPGAEAVLPQDAPHFAVGLTPGHGLTSRLAAVRSGTPSAVLETVAAPVPAAAGQAEVCLVTGGGAPTDETLEESLLGLRGLPRPPAEGALVPVLACDGRAGLGSARFVLDLRALLRQAGEELARSGALPAPAAKGPDPWEPAGALADVLCGYARAVILAPGLAEHEEGEDLREQLGAAPALAARLALVSEPAQLWPILEEVHGKAYRLSAWPLGWRGAC